MAVVGKLGREGKAGQLRMRWRRGLLKRGQNEWRRLKACIRAYIYPGDLYSIS